MATLAVVGYTWISDHLQRLPLRHIYSRHRAEVTNESNQSRLNFERVKLPNYLLTFKLPNYLQPHVH